MSRDVPDGWTPVKLGAAASNVTEKWEPREHAEPYVGLEQVDQGTGRLLDIGVSDDLQSIKTRFRAGDVLFGKLRPNLRKTALVDFSGIASTDILVIRPTERITPEFAFYRISSDEAFDYAIKSAAGTKMPRTSWKDMADFEFPLPPLYEQRRIAEILSSVDEAIAATRAVIDQTRKVKQGVLERLLNRGINHTRFKQTAIGEIPEGWLLESIGQIANVKAGATPSRALHDRYFAGGHIPWVKTGDLTNGEIAETEEMITEAAVAESSCEVHPAGTVLVAMYGGFQQIGRSGILTRPSATNQAISALRLRDQAVMGAYLNLALVGLRRKWRTVAASSRKDPNITKDDVLRFKVPVPPLEEQQQIVELMAGAEKCQQVLDGELLRLMGCKSALMSDLLTGRKRITDAVLMAAE
ncbi:restriction endonuclease subunit S [Agrobacterium radiobacter]|uniref:restriction endonuclease subunit S n=1 Tax=Agrobacterium radiobacter TaxID=362 RepID=UPI003F8405CA